MRVNPTAASYRPGAELANLISARHYCTADPHSPRARPDLEVKEEWEEEEEEGEPRVT